jgi:hypothetical protein
MSQCCGSGSSIVGQCGSDPNPDMEFSQFNKRLDSFAPCYSQSHLLADFKENHMVPGALLWFKPCKKSAKQEKSSLFMNGICRTEKRG